MIAELACVANPFRQHVVTDPWLPIDTDVPRIHHEAYQKCRAALEGVRQRRHNRSVLIFGEPGSGKTHLLGRLRDQWVGRQPRPLDPARPEVVFIAVKLQTSPRHLWRYLRRSMVDDLLRDGPGGLTQLERMTLRRLAEFRPADADLALWWDWLRASYPQPGDLEAVLDGLFDRLEPQAQLGRDLTNVLLHLLIGRRIKDARAWLRGDGLPESVLDDLGLAPPAPDDDADPEDAARQVVAALCRLCGPSVPVVFCFDQIEALQVDARDTAALFALGQLIMDLFNLTRNLLILTCCQIGFIETLKDGLKHQAAWDRMAMDQATLHPLLWDDAAELIRSRMCSVPELEQLRVQHPEEPLWPLSATALEQRVGKIGMAPRRILAQCADQFDAIVAGRTPPSVDSVVAPEMALARLWAERIEQAQAHVTPDRAAEIVAHGLPMLLDAASSAWTRADEAPPRDLDLVLQGPEGRIGLSVCNQVDERKLWRVLKRLPDVVRGNVRQVEKLVVLRDPRLPVRGGKTRGYLRELERDWAQVLRPGAEVLAALDTLRGLLSDSKAGDLEYDGHGLQPRTVRDWLTAKLPPTLRDFLDEILQAPRPEDRPTRDPDLLDRTLERLQETPVAAVREVASSVGATPEAIEACARAHPEVLGWLDGPPAVLFRQVDEPSEIDR
jgi:hypothetical protein